MNPSIAEPIRARSSTQIVARRVDLRESFARAQAVAIDRNPRLASRALIVSSLAGLVLTLVGHL